MSLSLLLQQCPACLVCLIWMVFGLVGRVFAIGPGDLGSINKLFESELFNHLTVCKQMTEV